MSKEYKPPRDINSINADFTRAALALGDCVFKIKELEKSVGLIHEQMRDLNFEAMASQRIEAEKIEAASKAKAAEEAAAKAAQEAASKEVEAAASAQEVKSDA